LIKNDDDDDDDDDNDDSAGAFSVITIFFHGSSLAH